MNIKVRLPCLNDHISVAVESGCPTEAALIYFHHLILGHDNIEGHFLEIARPSFAFDAFMRTINYTTLEIIRRVLPHFEILRGGAVVSGEGQLKLIIGRSGTGKTSRITSLIRNGSTYAGDDFLFFNRAFDRVYFLPISLLHHRSASITLQAVPSRCPDAPIAGGNLRIEVLQPRVSSCLSSPACEMLSLFLRSPGRAFPFREWCEQLTGRVVAIKGVMGHSSNVE